MWLILRSFKLPSVSDPCCGYLHFESLSMLQAKCLLDSLTAHETPFLWWKWRGSGWGVFPNRQSDTVTVSTHFVIGPVWRCESGQGLNLSLSNFNTLTSFQSDCPKSLLRYPHLHDSLYPASLYDGIFTLPFGTRRNTFSLRRGCPTCFVWSIPRPLVAQCLKFN